MWVARVGPPPPEVTDLSLTTSVTLMDTSTAQGELGWLLDPPEDGVSVKGGKAQSCRPVGNGRAERWVEERRKEQEKLEVSPQGGGREVSQSLPNGTFGGGVQASPHEERFNAWLLPSLPQREGAKHLQGHWESAGDETTIPQGGDERDG